MASQVIFNEGTAPATPSSNQVTMYAKADGFLYSKDDAGVETVMGFASPLSATQGGTGQTGYAVGDLLYASTTTALSKLADVATGSVLKSGGVSTAPSWGAQIIIGTPTATTSGTAIDITGLPTGIRRIVISLIGISANGSHGPIIQIGDSGGIETTGYLALCSQQAAAANAFLSSTAGVPVLVNPGAADVYSSTVIMTLENVSNNTWSFCGTTAYSSSNNTGVFNGTKSLSAVLDRIRLTTVAGTATFDAGELNIQYETT